MSMGIESARPNQKQLPMPDFSNDPVAGIIDDLTDKALTKAGKLAERNARGTVQIQKKDPETPITVPEQTASTTGQTEDNTQVASAVNKALGKVNGFDNLA